VHVPFSRSTSVDCIEARNIATQHTKKRRCVMLSVEFLFHILLSLHRLIRKCIPNWGCCFLRIRIRERLKLNSF
jgi:hypothetical protein